MHNRCSTRTNSHDYMSSRKYLYCQRTSCPRVIWVHVFESFLKSKALFFLGKNVLANALKIVWPILDYSLRCVYVCMDVYYMYVSMHACMYVMYVCMLCMYVHTYVRMHACMYVCMYI